MSAIENRERAQPQPINSPDPWQTLGNPVLRSVLTNVLILSLWLWLFRPIFPYLSLLLTDQFFRTTQIIFLVLIGLIGLQIHQGALSLMVNRGPQLAALPLTLAVGGAASYLLVARFLDMNIVASSLFFLASYGLLGLWMEEARWRQGLPAALLLVGALPFGEHIQTFIGYPMRIATAHLVGKGFHALGVGSLGLDTILTFENGIAHVDLPCSGVKSLWTGGIFLVAATWIERHPLNFRWLLIAALLSILLFLGNFLRVALLIGVGVIGQMELLAELLHVPLGVLSFGVACGLALWLLRRGGLSHTRAEAEPVSSEATPASTDPSTGSGRSSASGLGRNSAATPLLDSGFNHCPAHRPKWLSPTLMACIGIMVLLYQPRPQSGLAAASPTWSFPPEMTTTVEPLTAEEIWWLTKDGADSADRRHFQWGDLSGSMLLITSHTWRAHHRPERCFEVKGFTINNLRTHLVANDLPLRIVELGQGEADAAHSALYWFQSADQITDDYATRMWADLTLQPQPWVLVSLLFDDNHPPDDPALAPFYQAIARAVDAELGK